MPIEKSFRVFGEPVDVLCSGFTTAGTFSVATQLTNPGGGPPPHVHTHEDEFFMPIDGARFDIFDGTNWHPLPATGHFGPRGKVHTFRNAGPIPARILVFANSPAFTTYLEAISTLDIPRDMDRLISLSAEYGISFVQPEVPEPESARG